MGLKIYEVRIKLKTPAILTKRRSASGYLGTLGYIPASTLRGAILSALYRNDIVDLKKLKEERIKPALIASPAYPIVDNELSYPAHPFIYKCKECNQIVKDYEKLISDLRDGKEPTVHTECKEGHRALKSLHPEPIGKKLGEEPKKRSDYEDEEKILKNFRYVSVGISKERAASVKGMLYSYEALAQDQEFWATLTLPEEYDVKNYLEINIGRGISKGMGRAELKIRNEIDLSKEVERLRNVIKAGKLIMYSVSYMIGLQNNVWTTFPDKIDLKEVASRLGINGKGELKIENVYGRITSRITMYSTGWDINDNLLRPYLLARLPGSIVVARIDEANLNESITALAGLKYVGTMEQVNNWPVVGLNMLTAFEEVFS